MNSETVRESWEYLATDEAATERLGIALAKGLLPGAIVALNGPLGAGKTRLVKAIAAKLGVDRRDVNSPTFVLIHEYPGPLTLYHFDAYRLRDTDEFLELGAEELMESQGACLIEWAERVAEVLPEDRLTIGIEVAGSSARRFVLSSSGPKSASVLVKTREGLQAGGEQ